MAGGRPATAWGVAVALSMAGGCHRASPTAPSQIDVPIVSDGSTLPQLACPAPASGQRGPTYYVATNEPGADNERCDGLSPVDAGNGHCPFKDFLSPRTFRLLHDVAGVRVEVRTGVYTFVGEGLSIIGTGRSDADRVVLAAYQDEQVVFDGRNALRELVRVSGTFTAVERVTLRNAGAYNLVINGGSDHLVQCDRFMANLSSDSFKGDAGATRVLVRDNDFTGWDSQAIDMTAVRDWRIEQNDFHDPGNSSGNAIGAKLGTRDVVITGNRFRNTRGLSFGGTGNPHTDDYEAYNLSADHNRFENVAGAVVKFYSCADCTFRENDAKNVDGGIQLSSAQAEGPSGCPGGCRPTTSATIVGNRLTDLRGSPPDTFWGVYLGETSALSASDNLYCAHPDGNPVFWVDGQKLDFSNWVRTVGTDSSSVVARTDQAVCSAW